MSSKTLLAIGIGGFFGAVSRAYLTGFFSKLIPFHAVAIGTLSVNVLGSFIMGLLFAFFEGSTLSPELKSLLSTGFLGALTTYSTFALESFIMLSAGQYINFALNISLNIIGTIGAVALGFYMMQLFQHGSL